MSKEKNGNIIGLLFYPSLSVKMSVVQNQVSNSTGSNYDKYYENWKKNKICRVIKTYNPINSYSYQDPWI